MAGKTTKTNIPKTKAAAKVGKKVSKKTVSKKNVKKVAKKTVKKTEKKTERVARNRHFSIIYNGVRLSATPSGKRPKQAANKALTAIFSSMTDAEAEKMIGKDINFALYENCKRKKNAKGVLTPRRVFRYTGKREETAKMEGGKGADVKITHEVVKYCDKCKELIDKLRTIEPDNVITKKQVVKNVKTLNKFMKTDDIAKKPALNAHIKNHKDEYEAIVKCKSCDRQEKEIVYKYTNTVKKTADDKLTEDDKKITSEFIDAIEEKRKNAEKKEETKTDDKKKVDDKKVDDKKVDDKKVDDKKVDDKKKVEEKKEEVKKDDKKPAEKKTVKKTVAKKQ